jgi:uncharacterized protein
MKMSGEETIAAPIESVWAALNDPDLLKQCIPGCESITKKSDTEFSARVVMKIGPIKAGFSGNVELKDLKPPDSYRIEGRGEGGLAGFATGGANIRLEAVSEGTKMSYDVDAQVCGKMAMFFDKFAKLAVEKKAGITKVAAVRTKKAAVKKIAAKKPAAKKKTSPRPKRPTAKIAAKKK